MKSWQLLVLVGLVAVAGIVGLNAMPYAAALLCMKGVFVLMCCYPLGLVIARHRRRRKRLPKPVRQLVSGVIAALVLGSLLSSCKRIDSFVCRTKSGGIAILDIGDVPSDYYALGDRIVARKIKTYAPCYAPAGSNLDFSLRRRHEPVVFDTLTLVSYR